MFPLFRKNLSLLPSPSFRIPFPVLRFSSSPPPQPHCNQHKEDKVRVSVWWDFDTCGVPSGYSVLKVAPSIMGVLRANGINGPVNIRAYGDVSQFSKFEQTALSSTGISLCHITDAMKDRKRKKACEYLFSDLFQWSYFNDPRPFHLFVICGDVGSGVWILHCARMSNYNILVACPGMTCDVLRGATTIMWNWFSILKGEDLTGKHFNYPPDGPFDSWYGDSKVPLKPFSATSEPTSSEIAKFLKPSSYMKSGEVPESVSRLVKKISSSYPNGISIGNLRAELTKCDVPLGKPFYGHKKFSNFLVSIPHVQLLYLGEGKFFVHLIPSTTSAVKNNKQRDGTSTQKQHNEGKNMDRNADGIPITSSPYVSNMDDDSKLFQSISSQVADAKSSFPLFKESNVHQPPNLQKASLGSEKVVDVASAQLSQIQLSPNDIDISKNSDIDIVRSEDVCPGILEKKTTSQNPSTCNDYTVLENSDIANCEFGKAEKNGWRKAPHTSISSEANSSISEELIDDPN